MRNEYHDDLTLKKDGMDMTPAQWALVGCLVALFLLHASVYVTVRKLKQKIKELEERNQ